GQHRIAMRRERARKPLGMDGLKPLKPRTRHDRRVWWRSPIGKMQIGIKKVAVAEERHTSHHHNSSPHDNVLTTPPASRIDGPTSQPRPQAKFPSISKTQQAQLTTGIDTRVKR